MIDRERLLAGEHEARLHAEAGRRRLAADATRDPAGTPRSPIRRARLAIGHWLIAGGRRLDGGTDPCGATEARPA